MTATCHVNSCDAAPTQRVYWPGQPPVQMCNPCADRALVTANAMGFHLPVEPITEGSEP